MWDSLLEFHLFYKILYVNVRKFHSFEENTSSISKETLGRELLLSINPKKKVKCGKLNQAFINFVLHAASIVKWENWKIGSPVFKTLEADR